MRSVLVTGGTGTFGKRFVERCMNENLYDRIVIFSRDEFKQYNFRKTLISKFGDDADEKVKASKLPLYRVSEIVTQAHYRIRDAYSDEIIIPFDTVDNSTLMSTDSEGMYFDIYTNDFSMGRVYTIDVLFNRTNRDQIFLDAGGTFRIDP